MKIDFSKIEMKTITGDIEVADLKFAVGNLLYMQGMNVKESSLGMDIYRSVGAVELTDEQAAIICNYAERLPYVFRDGIRKALGK